MRSTLRRALHPLRSSIRKRRAALHARRFYAQFMSRGDLCFDVGANVGNRTALLLGLGARVIAVEPLRECRRALQASFGADPRFTLVGAAVGAEPGSVEILQPPGQSTIASMSPEWIERVRASGRFGEYEWTSAEPIEVTTLDALVERFGLPVFCKIDVEGYEPEVLRGLSHAVRSLSIEFTPERLEATTASVDRLESLGDYEYNYSLNESLALASERWLDRDGLAAALASFADDTFVFGDVYARLRGVRA